MLHLLHLPVAEVTEARRAPLVVGEVVEVGTVSHSQRNA
jgi:hypothetical protein